MARWFLLAWVRKLHGRLDALPTPLVGPAITALDVRGARRKNSAAEQLARTYRADASHPRRAARLPWARLSGGPRGESFLLSR